MNSAYIPRYRNKEPNRDHIIDAEKIFKVVEEHFGITRETLMQRSRKVVVVYPRQVCIWLLYKYSIHNARGIGAFFGHVDNSSSLNSVKVINDYLSTDERVKNQIAELENLLINK